MRKEFRNLAPPETAHDLIGEFEFDAGAETVPLAAARGRVLASRVDAALDVPGFDRSNVDGYAVRAADTFGADEREPAELDLIGTVHAGSEPNVTVEDGTAAEISTGAVLPPGADAVVMVERTATDGETVSIRTALAPGDNVMVAGADVAAGERTLGPETRLTPREIGLLSALGVEEVEVQRPLQVGIISTGDELVAPGDELDGDSGEIYDVNSHTIAAAVSEAGAEPTQYPIVGDDAEQMRQVLTDAAEECDLVLSSGSTSAGAVDTIYQLIEDHGELLLHGVAVKPGKPMLIGSLRETPYVGLPGFPVSALTIFRVFVAPRLRAASGRPRESPATIEGEMGVKERYREGRTRFMPVGLVRDEDGDLLVYPVDKGSGATTSLVDADGVVEIHPDTEQLDAGESVTVQLFSGDVQPPSLLGVGEDGPVISRLLDRLDRPRYLAVGSREGLRRLRDGLPDVTVTAGPTRREVETADLGGWTREWGLLVPAGNPEGVAGLGSLVESDLRFVNRDRPSGLRASLDEAIEAFASERDTTAGAVQGAIEGYEMTARAYESPPRRVLAGKADVALGLRATADNLDLGFVPLGTQQVRVRASPSRAEKPAVELLESLLPPSKELTEGLAGIGSAE